MKYAVLFISLLLTLTACSKFESEKSSKGVKYISECLHKNMESLEIENREGMSIKPPFEFNYQDQDVVVSFNQINGATHFISVEVQGKSSQAEADSVLESIFSSITKDCEP